MRMLKIIPVVLAMLTTLVLASEVYTVGMNSNPKYKSEGKEVIPWSLFTKKAGKLSYELKGEADGESFRCLVELKRLASGKNLGLSGNGNLARLGGDFFDEGQGVVAKVKVLSGNIKFDGFRAFSVAGQSAKGDTGVKVNGTSYVKNKNGIQGTGCFALGGSLDATEANFKFEAITKKQVRWIELQFSKVNGRNSAIIASGNRASSTISGALISIGDVTLIVE